MWVFVHSVKTNFCDWFDKELNRKKLGRSYRWDFQAERKQEVIQVQRRHQQDTDRVRHVEWKKKEEKVTW